MTIAKLPLAKEVDEFSFEDTPVNETLVRDLAGGEFLEQQRNVVLIGATRGSAAGSFVDYFSRDSFDNADEGEPRIIAEMPLLRISATRLVPAELRAALARPDVALIA